MFLATHLCSFPCAPSPLVQEIKNTDLLCPVEKGFIFLESIFESFYLDSAYIITRIDHEANLIRLELLPSLVMGGVDAVRVN